VTARYLITSASGSHKGNVRDTNEDACLDRPDEALWAVADGMGGHEDGAIASQMIVDKLAQLSMTGRASARLDSVDEALEDVNRCLYRKVLDGGWSAVVGSTVVALLGFAEHCVIAWVGDSRIYRLRDGVLEQLTRDHSQIEFLIDCGELSREEAESHPDANVITRAVGGESELFVDLDVQPLQAGDRYLLCSDGLFKELAEHEILQHLAAGDCAAARKNLLDAALARECTDNVTVVVVDFAMVGVSGS
jgi:serine/threonine protein phosphatase PrpC